MHKLLLLKELRKIIYCEQSSLSILYPNTTCQTQFSCRASRLDIAIQMRKKQRLEQICPGRTDCKNKDSRYTHLTRHCLS